jgi:uncharacterized membrane protein
MKAKVIVAGHALHAQLIVFPLGLLGISVLWDVLRLWTDNPMWAHVAFWTIVAGVASALVAAVPGFIDYLTIPNGTRAKSVATLHMILNLLIVALFAVSLVLRAGGDRDYIAAGMMAMLPGWVALGMAVVSGWLGGELVERMGIGVHEGAHPDAPSSLGGRSLDVPKQRPLVPADMPNR